MSDLHPSPKILKQDMFGSVELIHFNGSGTNSQLAICRDINCARWWVRYLARYLARRELKALNKLQQAQVAEQQVPRVLHAAQGRVVRSYIPGKPLHIHRKPSVVFFTELKELLTQIHRAKVTHNDLAKEPNILVTDDGRPALIDMQLASCGGLFYKTRCREALRHILKHQRTYQPQSLSDAELEILANKLWLSKVWMACVKPIYLFVTRRLLHWSDREGAGDRNAN